MQRGLALVVDPGANRRLPACRLAAHQCLDIVALRNLPPQAGGNLLRQYQQQMIKTGQRLFTRRTDMLRYARLAFCSVVREQTSHFGINLFRPAWAIIWTRRR